jgi:hypothetical protein
MRIKSRASTIEIIIFEEFYVLYKKRITVRPIKKKREA